MECYVGFLCIRAVAAKAPPPSSSDQGPSCAQRSAESPNHLLQSRASPSNQPRRASSPRPGANQIRECRSEAPCVCRQPCRSDTGFFKAIPMASRIILDTKYFVKDYSAELLQLSLPEDSLRMHCTVLVKGNASQQIRNFCDLYKKVPPYETFTLKKRITAEELKVGVEKTFREINWDLKSVAVESVAQPGVQMVTELAEKCGCEVVFEGSDQNGGKCSAGYGEHCVECLCGTRDDDGDICEVWQHTRCVRIPSSEEVPSIFLCAKCEQDITLFPSLP